MIKVTLAKDTAEDSLAFYVNDELVYDYHDPYFDEALRAIFSQPQFKDLVTFEIRSEEFLLEDEGWEWPASL